VQLDKEADRNLFRFHLLSWKLPVEKNNKLYQHEAGRNLYSMLFLQLMLQIVYYETVYSAIGYVYNSY